MKPLLTVTLAAVSAMVLTGPALADHHMAPPVQVTAMLTGAAQTGDGDMDGQGRFVAMLHPSRNMVCYGLSVSDIDTAGAAHIHTGRAGADGGVAMALTAPSSGTSSGCAEVPAEAMAKMLAGPEGFYVNVHNASYPAGAVRGQLMK